MRAMGHRQAKVRIYNSLLVDNQTCCDTIASLNHVTLVSRLPDASLPSLRRRQRL
jgi:hypothetical protein